MSKIRPGRCVPQESAAGLFGLRMQPSGILTWMFVEAVVEQDQGIEQVM
jgi:hypothetical protein